MNDSDKALAKTVAGLLREVRALSNASQFANSSIDIGGTSVKVPDAIGAGVSAGEAIPGLDGRLVENAAAVELAGQAADAAAIAAEKARTDALAAVDEVNTAVDAVDKKAIKAAADAANAAGAAAAADGKAVAAQNSASSAASKATDAANAASTADQKAVDAATKATNAASAASDAATAAKSADDRARDAAGLAGQKGKVIYATSAPTGDDRAAANLWINTTGGANTPNRWTGSAWAPVTDKTATDAAAAAAAAASAAQKAADAAKAADDKAAAAADAASFALSTANGKNSVTYSTAAPSNTASPGKSPSDLWFRRAAGTGSTIGIWEWTGSSWDPRTMNDQVIGNLDAGKITSGFIDAGRISAASITSRMIAIGDFTNLADDGTFETAASRAAYPGNSAFAYQNDPDGAHSGSWYFQLQEGAAAYTTRSIGPDFQVTPGEVIYLECWMRRDGATAAASLNLQVFAADKSTNVAFDLFAQRGSVSATNGVWNKISGQVTVPAGGFWVRPQLKHNGGAAAVGKWAWDDVIIRRAASGSLIVDGAIDATKIAANSITAAHLVADIISARELAADAVLARNIKAGEITAGKLAADSVTAVKIAAEAILARNIKAGEITAGKLAASSVVAANIVGGTITGDKIAANAITAREVKAGAITATELAADAIDGKTITGALFRTAAPGQARTESTSTGFRFLSEDGTENGSIQPDGASPYRVLLKTFTGSTIDQYEMRLGYQSWTGIGDGSGERAGFALTTAAYIPAIYTDHLLDEDTGRSMLASTWSGVRTSQDFSNGNRERAGAFTLVTAETGGLKSYGQVPPWMAMSSSGFQLTKGNYVITAKMTIAGTGIRATGRTFLDIVDQANPTDNLAHGPMPVGEDAVSVTWTGYTDGSRLFALWALQTSGSTRRLNLALSVTLV